jgi:SAM-dependent methyltransferase
MISAKTISAVHPVEEPNLSHAERNTLPGAIESIASKIQKRGDLPYISVARQLELLQTLSEFELGRFLLQRGGLDGYWTSYVIKHPKQGRLTGLNSENKPFSQLELFLLDQAPVCLATQQRFEIFKREIQKRLQNDIALASIPCGLTADLLDLDFSQTPHFSIYGIDIDPESLRQSRQIAENIGLMGHCQFIQQDAWVLGYNEEFDLITSNGLSIYEPDNKKIVDLYRQFFLALKPNGCLVTSFLTPPAIPGAKTEWDVKAVNSEHALLQKIIFSDILECKWQIFRSEELVRAQLLEAGFSEIEVFYDEAHIFPTIVAKKA